MADAVGDDTQRSNNEVLLLARLLGDAELRRRFAGNAQQVARVLTDDPDSIDFLTRLDSLQLESQAETLITKRQFEVAELLPTTWQRLGRAAASHFRNYAGESGWPEGYNRHIRDAHTFACWLSGRQLGELDIAEWNRIRFRLTERRLAIRIVLCGLMLPRLQILFQKQDGRIREVIWGWEWRRRITKESASH